MVIYVLWFVVTKYMKKKNVEPNSEPRCYNRLKSWQYDFKYYLIAALLSLPGNMLFSSLVMIYSVKLTSAASAVNLFLAVLVLVTYITFLVFFFSWSRKVKIGYVHPNG
jgi:hypothetical protein